MGVVPGINYATQQQSSTSSTVTNVTSSQQQTVNSNSNVSAIASGSEESHVSSLGGSRAVDISRPLNLEYLVI